MFKTTVGVWDQRRTTHTRWCTKQLRTDEANEAIPIPDCVLNNCWWMREMKESIPYDVRNNCWWMWPVIEYPYQMMYKRNVDGRDTWKNPFQIMHETTVDVWDQQRSTHTRQWTKQLLVDEGDEETHARWCTIQLLMDEANDGLAIPDDAKNTCWWTKQMKQSMPDDERNTCCWMKPTKDYP